MPLFVPVLRMFMLFLNVWDTFKTLKPPPRKIRNGKSEPPSVRSVTQRKRDLKGCLAVWIIWCCFSVYERHVEPVVSLFIPFYNEFKALVILFLIFTRARGAEPIFLHLLRPMLRPYTKTIDNSLELFRLVGDLLFAVVSFPLRPLAAFIPTLGSNNPEYDTPPPYSEASAAAGDRNTLSPFNGHTSTFHPADSAADMEWRQYPNLPSAYPPTPLVNTSRLPNPHPIPGQVGYDPGSADSPYAIWVPPVVEEDDEDTDAPQNQQDFHKSLLPPREPLHPGLGNHGGLSDESDRGVQHDSSVLTDIWRNDGVDGSGSSAEGEDMDVDPEDDQEDEGIDSDEDSFNITLQTPRVPLSLRPSSATASRSTIRMRASARSVFTDLEQKPEGRRHTSRSALLPPLDMASVSGNSHESSPSSIDPESLSISSGDDSMSLPNTRSGQAYVPTVPTASLIRLENDDIASDSSLGSAPGIDNSAPPLRFISPSSRGRKRTHSRSFPRDQQHTTPKGKGKEKSLANTIPESSLHRFSSVDSDSFSPAAGLQDATPVSTNASANQKLRSADPEEDEKQLVVVQDDTKDEVRVEEVGGGTRKRRKVISSGAGGPSTTSRSDPASLAKRVSSRQKPTPTSSSDKEQDPPRPTTRTRRQITSTRIITDTTNEPSANSTKTRAAARVKSSKPEQFTTSSVPTRKRLESTHTSTNASLTKSSTSTLRVTRSTAGLTSRNVDPESDSSSNIVGSGLEADDDA